MTVANVNVTKVLLKRGNTVQNNNYTGVSGELTIDTQLKTLRVHDGVTAGGNAITASGAIGSYSNTNTAAYLASQSITSANIGAFQTFANANAATQTTSINTVNANVGAYQTYANSNAATQTTSIDSINANVGAYQTFANANAATQTTEINSLRANITAANTAITSLTSNAAIQAALLDTLTGNAATQSQVLDTLTSNASAQANSLTSLLANAASQESSLTTLVGNAAAQSTLINSKANLSGAVFTGNVSANYILANNKIETETFIRVGPAHDEGVTYANPAALFFGNSANDFNKYYQILLQNVDPEGSGDVVVTADDGNDGTNYISLGINNSLYYDAHWPTSMPHDGYVYVEGGNLYVASGNLDVYVSAANTSITRFSANNNTYFQSNLIPAANVTYSLGSSTRQWKDLWVSNNTIYIGNTPIRVDGGTLLVNGAPVSGGSTYGNANVATYLPTYTGNIAGNIVKNGYTWAFGTDGKLTVPANGIITAPINQEFQLQARDTNSVLRNEINLDPNNGTYMSVWRDGTTSFSTGAGSWATASWNNEGGLGAARFTDAQGLQDFWLTGPGSIEGVAIEASINGGARTPNVFYENNNGETYGVFLGLDAVPPGGQGTTVPITSLVFYYRLQSKINMDVTGGGEILLDAQSMDLDLRTTLNLDLRAGENLNLRGLGAYPVRIYTNNSTHMWEFDTSGSLTLPSEGKINGIGAPNDRYGYISWDGNSSGDGSGYNTMRLVPDLQGLEDVDTYIILDPAYDGQTGNIHIRAGGTLDNSLANLCLGGANSHVKIGAGLNPPVTVMANNRSWTFGNTGTTRFPDGTILAPAGQNITMQSDQYAQLVYQNANLTVAPDTSVASNFYVAQNSATLDIVYRDGSSNQQQKSWLWSLDGSLTLPAGGVIAEGGGISGAIRLTPAGGANSNQALVIYPTGNAEGDHLHLTAGGGSTELYLGNDFHYVKLVDGGNIELRAATANLSSQAAWTFDTTGNVDTIQALGIKVPNGVPSNIAVINSTTGSWESNPNLSLATTGGSGTGLTVNVAETGGYASTIEIATAGTGYTNGDLITVTSGTSNATFTIVIGGRNTWRFGTDANLTLPETGYLRVGSGIVAGFASSPAPVISGFSSISAENFRFQGNGVNILSNLYANAAVQSANIATLFSNAATQATNIATINNTLTSTNVAIGYGAGQTSQGGTTVAIGAFAGMDAQGLSAVAIGFNAGQTTQGTKSVAIGMTAGYSVQGNYAVAIGDSAGYTNQGAQAIAIGRFAGLTNQANNTIILNATGANLNATTANTFIVAPVRNDVANVAQVMFYNTTSKEVTYGNTISVAGNINAGQFNFANGVNILSTVGANSYGNTQVATYLLNFDGDIEFTSSTAKIGNVDVITVGDHIRSPAYQFSNGASIFTGITGTYSNTNVAAYLTTATITTTGNITAGNVSAVNFVGTIQAQVGSSFAYATDAYGSLFNTGGVPLPADTNSNAIVAGYTIVGNSGAVTLTVTSATFIPGTPNIVQVATTPTASSLAYPVTVYSADYSPAIPVSTITVGNATVSGNVIAPNYLFANGVSILAGITGTYSNTNVAAYLTTATIATTGNITAGNLTTSGTFTVANITTTGTYGNITGANVISANTVSATNYLFANGVNILSTVTAGSTYSNTNVAAYLTTANISTTGNIIAGNVSATRYNFANGVNILSDVVSKTTGTWNVTTGTNTYSIQLAENGTYQIWVDCNIPNGILAYNATATVTNGNVPVVGVQYAWVYNGGGTPIDFVSIPNQFTGTANTIVRSSVAPSATTNRFDFGINNTSGGNVTVRYGWIAIS